MNRILAALLLATTACVPARAADITVAWAAAVSSADPHFHAVTPNNALANHVFSALTRTDPQGAIGPDLAASWEVRDGRTNQITDVDGLSLKAK